MKVQFLLPLFCATVGTIAAAQSSDWTYGGRASFGATLAGKEPQNDTATIGAGLWVERRLDAASGLFAEFNYRYFRASDHEVTKFGWGFRPDTANGGDIHYPYSGPVFMGLITPLSAADIRQDQLDGYGVMVGYVAHISPELSARFGLGGNVWISQQEVTGEVGVQVYGAATTAVLWKEGMAYVVSHRSLRPVVMAGGAYHFNKHAAVEFSASYITWRQANYVPFAYTGRPAHTESIARTKVTFDISLSITF
jgi:hypothetical protein